MEQLGVDIKNAASSIKNAAVHLLQGMHIIT